MPESEDVEGWHSYRGKTSNEREAGTREEQSERLYCDNHTANGELPVQVVEDERERRMLSHAIAEF